MNDFLEEIKKRILIFDGSKGFMLQMAGLKGSEAAEHWNLIHSSEVFAVYEKYVQAGSDVIQTNTFPGNSIYLEKYGLSDSSYDINFEGTRLAKLAAAGKAFVGASIGPTGGLFEPMGNLTFEKAFSVFREQASAVTNGGADLITFETFTDLNELRAAVLAAMDVCGLPLACSMSFEVSGKTLMGNTPEVCVRVLRSLGADLVGTNCSSGPGMLIEIIRRMYEEGSGAYLSVKPNAGMPDLDADGDAVYNEGPDVFARLAPGFVSHGVRLIGGCCGTTPDHIVAIKKALDGIKPVEPFILDKKCISSATSLLNIQEIDLDRISHLEGTDMALLLKMSNSGNTDLIVDWIQDTLDYNKQAIFVSHSVDDENIQSFPDVIRILQQYNKLPLLIRTNDKDILAKSLRIYNGIAGVCFSEYPADVKESLEKVARRFGSCIIPEVPLKQD